MPDWSWDILSDRWEEGFSYLKKFVEREGHCAPPALFKMADGYRLGRWVSTQRANRDTLPQERKVRLEALPGWVWDAVESQWEDGFRHLKEFADKEGDAKVSRDYKAADGYRVGSWVKEQRARKNHMSLERRAQMEALPGWVWDAVESQWEDGFHHLKEFSEREGHAKIGDYVATDGYRLGQWMKRQRKLKDKLPPERQALLEALPGWSWDPVSDMWEEGFRYLKEYAEREGHAKVPHSYKSSDGYRLGSWVGTQRTTIDKMSPEYKVRLQALPGWIWDGLAERWEVGFRHLKEFAEREEHTKPPRSYKTDDGYRLGRWVEVQRTMKDRISSERKVRLEALTGWVWRIK